VHPLLPDVFLRCAQYILSGDRHLLTLRTYRRIKILSPADFLSGVAS
jgi:predicted nucleic acid-binding protein